MWFFRHIFWQLIKKNIGLAAFFVTLLLVGTIGYAILSKGQYSLLDCLYMTVITITTVGYGEIIDLSHNPAGRVFTMFIAFSGIGVAAYVLSNVTALMVEGRLKEVFWRRRMETEIEKLQKHYIICSAEDVGFYIANELRSTQRQYVVVDPDETKIEKMKGSFQDGFFIQGDATNDDTLLKAGIHEAAGLFAVTGDDNLNLVISLTAKQLNPRVKVAAKCNDLKNSEKIRKAGADSVVSPAFIGGLRIVSEMIRPTTVSFLDTMLRDKEKNLRVEEIPVPESFADKPLRTLSLEKYPSALLLAIKRKDDWIYNPPEDYILQPGNILIFMIRPEERLQLERIFMNHPSK